MNDNKTKPTTHDVTDFLAGLPLAQQADSQRLVELMQDISGEPPVMWGTSIVGFGRVHYKYASGREGEWMRIGFAPRKSNISLYLTCDANELTDELADLGKHKTGKGCIYINKLADVDGDKLRELVRAAYDKAPSYYDKLNNKA